MARFHKETMKERIARLEREVREYGHERHVLFAALEEMHEAACKVSGARPCAPEHPIYKAREKAREALIETCRCSCGRSIGWGCRPRMCEVCLST